jgi:hypothetical protein
MSKLSWNKLKLSVYERANGYCEYCQTSDANTGQIMHTEHIDPLGGDIEDNLCLACPNCNSSKFTFTTGIDPTTLIETPLFNPRQQKWNEHFRWSDDGLRLEGLTPIGRATIVRLKINRDLSILAQQRWVIYGLHPPR